MCIFISLCVLVKIVHAVGGAIARSAVADLQAFSDTAPILIAPYKNENQILKIEKM